MIRFARQEDILDIKRLWHECFGQDNFAKWYFENLFDIGHILVYEQDGQVVAKLSRIPCEIEGVGKVTYIYGACTDKKYRRQGIMSKMLAYSENIDRENGIVAVILIPENEGLFSYYNKCGYTECFYRFLTNKEELAVSLEENNEIFISNNNEPKTKSKICLKEITKNETMLKPNYYKIIDEMLYLYNKVNKDSQRIIRDEIFYNRIIGMYNHNEGKVYTAFDDNNQMVGYIFAYEEEELTITELLYEKDEYKEIILEELLGYCNRIKILNELNGNIKKPYGFIKLLQKNIKINKIIINLMYD